VLHPRGVVDPPSDRYEAALRQLPDAYALALRMRGAGATDAELCLALQIEPEGLDTLIAVAAEKLAAVLEKS
jgi:DNA-directed RNA polymerase specialized sigma24 family protein